MKYAAFFLCLALILLGYGLRDVTYGFLYDELPITEEEVPSFGERFLGVPPEQAGPQDRISEQQIIVLPERVVLQIKDAQWSTFTDTNSMDPVIDTGANAIQVVPQSPDELQVGDIISYEPALFPGIIIHRIVDIGEDEEGWFARTRGDNAQDIDPAKVRFDQVRRVVVAIIY